MDQDDVPLDFEFTEEGTALPANGTEPNHDDAAESVSDGVEQCELGDTIKLLDDRRKALIALSREIEAGTEEPKDIPGEVCEISCKISDFPQKCSTTIEHC